jgi:4-oxalocrotonate tautomerase
MPHIVVKLWPGPSEKQKAQLAQDIVQAIRNNTGSGDESVSVAIEEVPSRDWMDKVYRPEIAPAMQSLYKKPGYGPF